MDGRYESSDLARLVMDVEEGGEGDRRLWNHSDSFPSTGILRRQ
jgi:hypothetical protein